MDRALWWTARCLPYGSDAWRKVYQERLANYLAMVEEGGARVVWVGLPPMRVPVYDEKIAAINRIAYTVVSQSPQATWWNPAPYVGDDAGRFREFVTLADGQTMRMRSTDGIHLSDEGAGLLSTVLLKWLDPLRLGRPTALPRPRRFRLDRPPGPGTGPPVQKLRRTPQGAKGWMSQKRQGMTSRAAYA